jgi:hypothetical protein
MSEVNLKPALLYFLPSGVDWPDGPPREFVAKSGNRKAQGPDQKRGEMFSHFPNSVVKYSPATQVWRKMFGGYYIGYEKGYTPDDFKRDQVFGGGMVELTDGNSWEIAVANPMFESCDLPMTQVRDTETGEWILEVREQYRELSDKALDIAGKFRETIITQELSFDSEDEVREVFCDVIALNYDLTRDEIEALRLLDQSTYLDVLQAFVDWPTMRDMLLLSLEEANAENPTEGTSDGKDIVCGVPGI